MFSLLTSFAVLTVFVGNAAAQETHTVHFTNLCGFGTPTLIQGPNVLSTGEVTPPTDYTSSGPLLGAIAYLQYGVCGFNGEGCTLIETSLNNGFSSSDISLIPPHSFSVTSGFGYYNGCDGAGADCTDPSCPDAMTDPSQTYKQVGCPAGNVDIAITFCD
ncbi:glycopeptide [Mycena maculata]|uniref:Glycopeptide n=1 Tax=Mycena maculata TaxID=230809 RepID=A0AAD7P2I8_9AGAR|nr:glycopeptide [Mycena maculata]